MTPFLPTLQALIAPERYTAVEHLWLVLWAHPGALAAEQILRHLVTGLAEEETRLARLDAQDLCEDLAHWRETGLAVLRVMEQLPPDLQTQVQRSAKHKTAHPLTRHGLTANSLYAAFWNRHEEETWAAAFRRLQCVSLRLQQHLIEAHGIAFADYSSWFANQTGDKATASLDFFAHQHGLGLSNLGWALRTLSWQRHTPLLQAIDRCTAPHADLTDILTAWMRLSEDQTAWASQDAHTQQERQRVADSLRLIADKALQSTQRVTRKRTKGARQRQTGRGVESGFITDLTRQRHDHPPEDLPEFEDWVPTEEVLWPEPTEEGDEGIEAPRPSGLHLVHPHELAGRVARLQAQRHYLAMLHHSFGWDSAALTDTETALLSRWYDELRAHSHDSLTPTTWAQAAVLVSWLLGRSIEEVLRLQVLSAEEATYDSSVDVAIVETDPSLNVYAWRIALRQPVHRHYNYDHRLDRVRFLLIPDQTGLAAVLMRWHHPSGPRAARLWPAKQEHTHTAHAQAALAASDAHSGAHNRLSLTMIKRHLRLTLLNLVPDRTIAWMLAGTPQDAVSPRMFYAAHTPEELIFWMQKAQARLLQQSATDPAPTVRPPATPYLDGQMRSYAGAKFLPECASLRALCVTARLLAQHAPPAAYLSPNDTEPPSANSIWMQVQTWRQWHDHVVRWAWLVQALLTGMRALKDPSTLYHQWLKHPRQRWLSIEDKLSKDHDESRFTWLSPLLNEAFDTLTVVQLLYQERWADASGARSKMPIGFVVFDEHTTPKALRPAHLSQWLEQQQRQWPVNFNRALLRRVWSELGMSNDGLDTLLGHGATGDRLHDRHSLFDPARFTKTLRKGLLHIARAFQLGRLHNRHRLSRHHPRYERHRQQALDVLANRSKVPAVAVPRDTSPFERWCQLIAQAQCLQDAPSVSALHDLHPWFELLQQHTHLEYARYLLRQPNALEPLPTHEQGHAESVSAAEVQRHAQALEDALVEAVRQGQLGRSIAAQGFGVAYRISKALHPERPTMRLAITPPARVSPYSISRLYSAAQTDAVRQAALAHLRPSPQPPVTDADWQRHHAILACFLNVTSHPARWSACMQALQQPHSDVDVIFAQRYEYVLKRWDERRRVLHGFVEVLSRQVPLLHVQNDTSTAHDPVAAERQNAKGLFRSQRIKGMPMQLGGWTQGLAWWSYLHLPALIAEHLAGRLDDQSATGPWLAQFPDPVWTVDKALHLPASAPPSVDAHIPLDGLPCPIDTPPLGWSETLPHAATPAGAWVKAQLAWHVGAEERQRDGLQATLLQLPAAAPAPWREQVRALVRAIQAREGLVDPSQPLAVAWVDRQVIDHDTYYAVLAHLERQMLHRRASQRQRHLRLLIVLAFRFGMRRREILGLRAMDVALEGEGRIHIRPYAGHRLKTRFSARSLPIAPLLPAQERQWLCEACQARAASDTLIPLSEWDTLTREAIGVLRQLGGDDTLKLHHLRHSFASLLTLKVILARHPEWVVKLGSPTAWAQEWAQSPALVGTLLKPWDASADFLVVPRLLGHSSYQVSLTHYVHTLDVAAALYLEHELSPRVMANRDLVHLVRRRYATGLALRTGAACGPTGWTAAPAVQHPLSAKAAFEDTLMQCLHAEQAGEPIKIVGVTRKMIEDWFAPRHAAALRDQLWQACERAAVADLVFLRRVTARYWKDEPPLFWFNAGGEDAHTVLDDALALCRLWLKLGFAADQIVVWRYAQASVRTHKTVWKPVWSALRTACSSASISGRSDSPMSLGLSLCSSHGARVKRSALLGFWCRVMSAESSC